MTVVLIGPPDDPQMEAVDAALADRGIETVGWDSSQWPGEGALSFTQDGRDPRIVVDDPVDVADLTGAYFRRIGLQPTAPEHEETLAERPYSLVNQLTEYRGLVTSIVRYLETCDVRVVNPMSSLGLHSQKPLQLARFADEGVPVPATCSTNDPAAVRSFVDRVGDVIYKPISGGGHAREVSAGDLDDDRLQKLSNSPVQFQERVDGDNLRLFVVDGDVVAAGRIESDALDYRTTDHDVVGIDPRRAVREAATTAAAVTGLPFTGVDVIDAGDRFVVLEANPSPMFAQFDALAGTDVATHLADLLVA